MIIAKGEQMFSENQIVKPVLQVLSETKNGRLSTTNLRKEVKARLPLTAADMEPLRGRNDVRIDQIIRNLKSHKNVEGNPFCEGLLDDVPGGFKITSEGEKVLQK